MTSNAPSAARTKLDEAIREYTAACDETADEQGAFMVTGWVMIVSGIRSSFNGDDGASYISESMPGQPWHAGLGLWVYGQDQCRFGSVITKPGDDE